MVAITDTNGWYNVVGSRLTGILLGLMRFRWDIVMGHTGKLMEGAWFINVYTLQCHQTWLINPLQMELWFAGKITNEISGTISIATFDYWRVYHHLSLRLKQIGNLKRSSKVDRVLEKIAELHMVNLWGVHKKKEIFCWLDGYFIFHSKKNLQE